MSTLLEEKLIRSSTLCRSIIVLALSCLGAFVPGHLLAGDSEANWTSSGRRGGVIDHVTNGRLSEAVTAAEAEIAAAVARYGADSAATIEKIEQLAHLQVARGNYPEAERLFRHCLALGERHYGSADRRVLETRSTLTGLLMAVGKVRDAEELMQNDPPR